jgi:hypothetical protein
VIQIDSPSSVSSFLQRMGRATTCPPAVSLRSQTGKSPACRFTIISPNGLPKFHDRRRLHFD